MVIKSYTNAFEKGKKIPFRFDMWGSDEDILGFDTSPEMKKASHLLERAGDMVAEDTLPLKKMEASCAIRCFDKVRDIWNMSTNEKRLIMSCVEKCEEPMEQVGDVLEEERNKMLESTTSCLERCREDDESCANQCISSTLTDVRVNDMISRVRAKILAYKYS